MGPHDSHTRKILTQIEMGGPLTQRILAKELGVALGLTNLLVRRIVTKGWVKVTNVKRQRVRYLITPAGVAEKTRITRAYFNNTLHLYTETRERIRERLTDLSAKLERDGAALGGGGKRVAFYGAGEVAEIGYISLQSTDLRLVAVVDDRRREPFFGIPVHPPSKLQPSRVAGEPFARLVVMSFRSAAQIRERLEALRFPQERLYWL